MRHTCAVMHTFGASFISVSLMVAGTEHSFNPELIAVEDSSRI